MWNEARLIRPVGLQFVPEQIRSLNPWHCLPTAAPWSGCTYTCIPAFVVKRVQCRTQQWNFVLQLQMLKKPCHMGMLARLNYLRPLLLLLLNAVR